MTVVEVGAIPSGAGFDPVLRTELGVGEPLPRERLLPAIGGAASKFLIEIRGDVRDGKLPVDALLANGHHDIEAFATLGYENGLSAPEMLTEALGGELQPYTAIRPRLVAEPNESMFDFSLRLRPHQERPVKIGTHEFRARATCDGRYPELYPLDMGSIAAGYDESGDTAMLQDMVDITTEHTLTNGIPFNGMRIDARQDGDHPFHEHNYYASRAQTPTYFDMLRRLGKHIGEAVYTHKPYVRAMEQILDHFSPAQAELAMQPRGQFHAFRRGGISPEGWPFAVYGDDRNNGRAFEDYIGRDESFLEDELAASAAAMREPDRAKRLRVYADTKVHLRAAGEGGEDMCLSRYGDGESLSSINTTNVAPLELQLMLIDGERMLAHSYGLLAMQAERVGNIRDSVAYDLKRRATLERVEQRVMFVETYAYDEQTMTYHDVVLEEPSGPYDSMRSYTGYHSVKTVSAVTGHILRTLAYNGRPDRLMSTARVARAELFGLGGVASTNVATGEQWDGWQGWASNNLIWLEAPVEAAAAIADDYPEMAEELLAIAADRQEATLRGSQAAFNKIHMIAETNNTHAPGEMPVEGEYPKSPDEEDAPQNFAMQAELVVFASLHDPRARLDRLVAARTVISKELAALAA